MQSCALVQPNRTTPIWSTPCLTTGSGRLSLPLPFGDPPARQVPLFIKWEDYSSFIDSIDDVTFVQIGANCGKNTYGCAAGGDPLWSYATSCGWRGIALEPVSYVFALLCKNYGRWAHRITPLRGAVSDAPGTALITLGGGETNKLLHDAPTSKPRPNETVPVVTLEMVWAAFNRALGTTGQGPDLLVIDAEGAEPRILGVTPSSAQLDFGSTDTKRPPPLPPRDLPAPLPSLILFEHSHLKLKDQRAIHANLMRQGYTHLTDLKNKDPRGIRMPPANRLYGLQTKAGRGAKARSRAGKSKTHGGGGTGTRSVRPSWLAVSNSLSRSPHVGP